MKIIVEENAGCAEEIKIEYTPTEALIINHAMRRYACDEDVSANNRGIMERMLETEPIFIDKEEENDDAISRKAILDATVKKNSIWNSITNSKGENLEKIILQLPPVNPQEPKWDRLYNWLNDMRLGIAPDETVADIDERNERMAQADLLDEIMEWIEKAVWEDAKKAIEQDTVPFDFELYQAGLMDAPEGMIEVLDAIKTEVIARDRNVKTVRSDGRCLFTAEEILEIIDKYKKDVLE